ncbi:MAG TPA: hypothetical protein VH877_09540 [Polyangia bacterium]|nr:hypothetical protein [Polyangia bacterium]
MKQLHRAFFRPFVTTLVAAVGLLAAPEIAESRAWGFGGQCGPVGSSRLLAPQPVESRSFPPTGSTYPEGIAVLGDRILVSGPGTFYTAGNGSPSQLTVFDRKTGAFQQVVKVKGEDLNQEHNLSELSTWMNYAYSPSNQLGVLRWKFSDDGTAPVQESYSAPFYPVTDAATGRITNSQCPSNLRPGLPPLVNGIDVDIDGDVYVTDSFQGVIWRVPGPFLKRTPITPEVLFCSRALQGSGDSGVSLFGANGIAVIGSYLYVSVSYGPNDTSTGAPTSVIYRLRKNHPDCLERVYTYRPAQVAPGVYVPPLADGLRFDPKSGHLFVVLSGHNQISELRLTWQGAEEVTRYSRATADHPFQGPSTIAFGPDDSAYVNNHAAGCCLDGDTNPSCYCQSAADYFGVIQLCVQ